MNEDAKRWIYWTIPIVVVIGLAVALYYGRQHNQPPAEPGLQSGAAPIEEEPSIRHPVGEDTEPAQPLPPLADSDRDVQESLGSVFGSSLEPFLIPQDLIRRFVVTVDNLPQKKMAVQLRPLKPTAGELATQGTQELTLDPSNYARYAPLVSLLRNTDATQLAGLYKRYYPLFQEAYTGLGYPDGYFNDRLVEVIDHLLATPQIDGPIRLTRPSVYYQFADESLEERSAGQKLLLRMGSDNAAVVKAKLRELRQEVTQLDVPTTP